MTSIKNHYFLAFYLFTVQLHCNIEMLQPVWYWAKYYKAEILATCYRLQPKELCGWMLKVLGYVRVASTKN